MRLTKEQAIEILDGLGYDPFRTDLERVEALATAGAFTDGAVLSVEECDAIRKAVAAAPGLNLVALNAVAKLDAQAHATPSRPVATEAPALPSCVSEGDMFVLADGTRLVAVESRPVANGASETHDAGHSHLIAGEFQSDKYPTTPRGKVPLSCKDPTAQDLLWTYAQRRRAVDAEFATDLEIALRNHGYEPASAYRPVAAGSKARADEIALGLGPCRSAGEHPAYDQGINDLLRALDRAGLFPDEATLAEIAKHVHALLHLGTLGIGGSGAIERGIALATAVRKLGIGGGE